MPIRYTRRLAALLPATVLVSLGLSTAPLAAQVTISTLPGAGETNPSGYTNFTFAQSFRVPDATNVRLTQFQFSLGITQANAPYAARIFAFNTTTNVAGTLLAEQTFAAAPVAPTPGTSVIVPFAFNLLLSPGTDYLFALTYTNAPTAVIRAGLASTPYANGDSYFTDTRVTAAQLQSAPFTRIVAAPAQFDLAFSATFNPAIAAVPEPATLALVGGGLLLVGGVARRRRA